MNTAPEPIFKGIFRHGDTGKNYNAFHLKHNADAGETGADDCMLTVPRSLEGGEHNCGESGCYPIQQFAATHQFVAFPKP